MRNKISIVFLVSAFLSAFLGPPAEAQFPIQGPGSNDPPVARNVFISGTPRVGQVLTGNYTYTDAEDDPQGASSFRWFNSTPTGVFLPIDGVSAQPYTLVAEDEGRRIRFRVTPVARRGASPGDRAISDPVGPVTPPNAPPTASNVLIAGTPQVGQVLTGSYDYADAENDPQGASSFRWLRRRVGGLISQPIDGATAQTYTLVATDEGARIRFQVTPRWPRAAPRRA